MMPRKLYMRMVTAQEEMAKTFVAGDMVAYEKAEQERESLMSQYYNKLSSEQDQDWSAVCARLDAYVSANIKKETFQEAVAKDTDMTPEQKEYWLSQ